MITNNKLNKILSFANYKNANVPNSWDFYAFDDFDGRTNRWTGGWTCEPKSRHFTFVVQLSTGLLTQNNQRSQISKL